MTSQTGRARVEVRRAIAGGVLALGLMSGFGVSTAFAQPADPTDQPAPRSCTGDDCTRDAEAANAAAAGCEPDDKKCSDRANTPKKLNGDQILMQVYEQYSHGDGGGQISTLVDDAVNLRKQGYPVSQSNAEALLEGLNSRPNQTALIEALKSTIAYQRKIAEQQQLAAQQQQQQQKQQVPGANLPVIPGS